MTDRAIDAALVQRLVEDQHPDLLGTISVVGRGWDNVVARLGEHHAVRVPCREVSAELMANELRWLPELELPVPFPMPLRRGEPTAYYPWSWSITAWFEGRVVADVAVADRDGFAAQLADVHRALHRAAPANAPHNPVRGVPLAQRAGVFEQRIASGRIPDAASVWQLWQEALDAPAHEGVPVWVHGDMHPANLVAADGLLAAVLDFGDLCQGDPATDLAAAWMVFGPKGRADYRAGLDADDALWARARGWAALLAAAFLASSRDDDTMTAIGRHTISQLLTD